MTPEYPWMAQTLYEPTPIKRTRRPHVFVVLGAIAIATGALIAASQIWGMT